MRTLVGLYHLRLLWIELQRLYPDKNGFVTFNFQSFKRVHDIEDSAIAPEA